MGSNTVFYNIDSLKKTKIIAEFFAVLTKKGDVLALCGNLGSGKTTFTRFFINQFCKTEIEVPSPSFSLVQQYNIIWHFDFYRLNNIEEIYELGIEEALSEGISIIEWPEIFKLHLPKTNTVFIYMENSNTSDYPVNPNNFNSSRNIKIEYDPNWHSAERLSEFCSS